MKRSGPSRAAEWIAGILVPPACREDVLGDLHERYRSAIRYAGDVIQSVPLVILSRIRRTSDPHLCLLQALALSVSFLGVAWARDPAFLRQTWGLLRLAIPPAMALLGVILEDAYADPRRPPPRNVARGPLVGAGMALASQWLLAVASPNLRVPPWILVNGCAMGVVLSAALRMLFPPVMGQLQNVNAPAGWLKRSGGTAGSAGGLRMLMAMLAVAIVCGWVGCHLHK